MHGISWGLQIARIGLLAWHFLDDSGEVQVIETEGYYVPDLNLHLLSPQLYFQECKGGYMQVKGHVCKFVWKNEAIMTIASNLGSCIPIAHGFLHGQIGVAGGELYVCITNEVNQNLTSGQKLLLKWHFKLKHIGFD